MLFICIFNHVFFQMSVGMLKLIPAFTLGWTELMSSLLIPLCSLERVTILFIQRYCCRKQYITHLLLMLPPFLFQHLLPLPALSCYFQRSSQSLQWTIQCTFLYVLSSQTGKTQKSPRKLPFFLTMPILVHTSTMPICSLLYIFS